VSLFFIQIKSLSTVFLSTRDIRRPWCEVTVPI